MPVLDSGTLVLPAPADAKPLTPNQKKKRRQKLAKLGARNKVQTNSEMP